MQMCEKYLGRSGWLAETSREENELLLLVLNYRLYIQIVFK
jgi:hypothetical protein